MSGWSLKTRANDRPRDVKRAPPGRPFLACAAEGRLALAPARLRLHAAVAARQRDARFQPLELDPGAGAGAQQTVGSLAQRGPVLLRVLHQRRVEGGKKG